ncbi:hypothetical protein ACFZCY_30975 [Streptomyces sp. NPDC007983]|uniref:hypothetical protein n=1 Tax=Streptomyces sp. NPDC007983 TaxID=3364800 RepID=UPI0036E8DB03
MTGVTTPLITGVDTVPPPGRVYWIVPLSDVASPPQVSVVLACVVVPTTVRVVEIVPSGAGVMVIGTISAPVTAAPLVYTTVTVWEPDPAAVKVTGGVVPPAATVAVWVWPS